MFGFGNPRGELIVCPECGRSHDILRGTACVCACGNVVKSKEFSAEKTIKELFNT